MGIIYRKIQPILEKSLNKGKILVIYGARQVGKTTLIKEMQKKNPTGSIYLNCDQPDIREALTNKTSTELKAFVGDKKLVFIDEAQRVKNIGLTLKLIKDNFPEIQVVATGSSSFDLSNEISEPLTGRKFEFYLYPLSLAELRAEYSDVEINRILEQRIIFGMYPDVINGGAESENILKEITRSYLYKDVAQYQGIRNHEAVEKLLQALALQIGNEVSYNELANLVGIDKKTVENYIRILEQAFIIFRLGSFSSNMRNELKRSRKIYFYDTGIRNALINNLNPFNLRQDAGALWENFLISERIKLNSYRSLTPQTWFWRAHSGQEVDYIEIINGKISAFEFKISKDKSAWFRKFLDLYPDSSVKVINKNNYQEFVF